MKNETKNEIIFVINKWEKLLRMDANRNIWYGRKVLKEIIRDFKKCFIYDSRK